MCISKLMSTICWCSEYNRYLGLGSQSGTQGSLEK